MQENFASFLPQGGRLVQSAGGKAGWKDSETHARARIELTLRIYAIVAKREPG
jgi:hypothetical protein